MAMVILFAAAPAIFAQNSNSSYLQAAAQGCSNAAAQCQNPAGAACLRSYASYENCMAGGGSCHAPTCNTSCAVTGGAGAGLVTPLSINSAAATKAQQGDNLINMGISLFSLFHSTSSSPQPADNAPAPDPAAAAALQQQIINAEAADLLAQANALMPSQPAAPMLHACTPFPPLRR